MTFHTYYPTYRLNKPIYRYLFRLIGVIACVVCLASCQEHTYRIGLSQSGNDPWHEQLTNDLVRAANSHLDLEMVCKQANHSTNNQIKDLEALLDENIDLLIVSPNDAMALVPTIERFYDRGIPVILAGRKIHSGKYTASISADNQDIGERVGNYIAGRLAGRGRIIEIQGPATATSCQERHYGLRSVLDKFPEIEVVSSISVNWDYYLALHAADSLLRLYPNIDLITAQNDVMASAAYEACERLHIHPMPAIVGVDGLTGPGNGLSNITDGMLSATCLNPTGASETIEIAYKILQGEPFNRNTVLSTVLIDENNVSTIMMYIKILESHNKKIEELNGELGDNWRRIRNQHILLMSGGIILALIIAMVLIITRNRREHDRLRQKVEEATQNKLEFFTNVSHSFRTPLSLIADPLRQLRKEEGLTERQTELVDLMNKNAESLLDLTDQVLNVLQTDLSSDAKLDALAKKAFDQSQLNAEFVAHQRALANEQKAAEEEINRQTILVIDDNADLRQYLSMLLEPRYVVLTATNGEEGLLEAQQNMPDLIICDVFMPVMDGLECCTRLKQDAITSHIPVLLLTAYALDDQRIEGYKRGADDYMTKPFNSEVLLARIKNLLISRRHIDTGQENTQEQMAQAEFSSVDTSFVTHLQDYIISNMGNADLSINDLCSEMNMSRVQLYRKCKSLTNVSPVELVRNLRLKQAKLLLKTSQQSVSEIAYEVGFSSPSYFAKCYRDQYGVSPTEVRNKE